MRPVDVIVNSKQVARSTIVAADVCSRLGNLRCTIRCRAAADHDGANRFTCYPARQIQGRVSGKEVARARKPEACGIEKRGRKDMLLLDARHLLAKTLVDPAQR